MPATGELTYSRLFFALWPDDAARQRIAVLAEEFHHRYGGRRVATPSLHITLAFLGSTLDSRIPALQGLAREVDAAVFDLLAAGRAIISRRLATEQSILQALESE